MKRIAVALLLLSLCLLCFGCGKDTGTSIRYQGDTASYIQEGAQNTMELHFAAPVSPGSELCLLSEGNTILSFKTEAAVSSLTVATLDLKQDTAYTLTVNGTPQCFGTQKTVLSPSDPGYIPDPTLSTPSQEPMGDASSTVSGSDAGTETAETTGTDETSSPFDTPPSNFNPDLTVEEIPTIVSHPETEGSDESVSGGLLSTEPFASGKGEETSAVETDLSQAPGNTAFVLTSTFTMFTSVRDAS